MVRFNVRPEQLSLETRLYNFDPPRKGSLSCCDSSMTCAWAPLQDRKWIKITSLNTVNFNFQTKIFLLKIREQTVKSLKLFKVVENISKEENTFLEFSCFKLFALSNHSHYFSFTKTKIYIYIYNKHIQLFEKNGFFWKNKHVSWKKALLSSEIYLYIY